MQLVAHNTAHAIFSDEESTKLIEMGTFKVISTLAIPSKIGYLQYGTGMAALVS